MKRQPYITCFVAIIVLLLFSCRTTKTITEVKQGETLVQRDTVIRKYTDTVRIVKLHTDTLRTHDSIYVSVIQRNDTVFVEKYKELVSFQGVSRTDTLWKVRTDTLYLTKTDTLRIWKFMGNDKVVEKNVWPWEIILFMAAVIIILAFYIFLKWQK